MKPFEELLLLCGIYCRATGLAEATLSSRMLGDGKRLTAIRANSDMGVRRLARAMQWLSENWPEGAEWPESVVRPQGPVSGKPLEDSSDDIGMDPGSAAPSGMTTQEAAE